MRCASAAALLLSIWSVVSAADASVSNDVDDAARRELATVLQTKYSGVTRWSLQLIESAAEVIPALPRARPTNVSVLHTGARSAVRVFWTDGGAARRSHTLWYEVAGSQLVPIAMREIFAGAEILAADTGQAERDVVALGCAPAASIESLRGMRARRVVRPGQPFCQQDLERRPAVARGDTVTVHYTSSRVDITTKAVAQRDAEIGQTLRVINPINHEPFTAVVSANQEVVIND
jgi:flagella basal body P-ring formation protein FlgA